MTDSEKDIVWLNVKNDLKAIASNNKYLTYKLNKLSDDRKNEIMYLINMYIMNDSTATEETNKTENSTPKKAVIDDASIHTVYWSLPDRMRREVYDHIHELFQLEPSYKGKRAQLRGMYKRLCPLSKRIISDHINRLIETDSKALEKQEAPNQNIVESAIIIDFQSQKPVRKGASL